MKQQRLAVNCIVQVKGDNKLDFEEWLNYHIALGFDTIYVFDTGNHAWLDEVCKKRPTRVVMAPRDERWKYKSDIIADYVSRREIEEWCICLDEHDFLWISPARARSIIEYTELIPPSVAAVTFYVKHMSSKDPMRYRVGTQLDCFTHTRREPEGFYPSYKALPNTGVTMFRVVDHNMPLRDPVTPLYTNKWVDCEFRQMTPKRLANETASQRFSPMAYPIRCYRYGIRSGVEMNFEDAMVPNGFTVLDLSMQQARERFMHVPVNAETETLFAKREPPETPPQPEAPAPDPDELAERNFPITRARIDKLIFKGQYLEDIAKYVESKDPNYDRAVLARLFEEERANIVASSPLYTELQELLDQGKTDEEIRVALVMPTVTLAKMKLALPVLDIVTQYAPKDEEPAPTKTRIKVNVVAPAEQAAPGVQAAPLAPTTEQVPDLPEGLVEDFEAYQDASTLTPEEQAARDEALATMDAKAKKKGKSKKAKTSKKSGHKVTKVTVVAGSAKPVAAKPVPLVDIAPAQPPQVSPEQESALETALDSISDDSLGDMDINMDDIVGSRQTVPQDIVNQ